MALASEARQVLYLIIYNRNIRNLRIRMKKKIQRAEVTEEFKDPNDRVMKLITSDVLEVIFFLKFLKIVLLLTLY